MKKQLLKASLQLQGIYFKDWCESIKRDRSFVYKYLDGRFKKTNSYIDHKVQIEIEKGKDIFNEIS